MCMMSEEGCCVVAYLLVPLFCSSLPHSPPLHTHTNAHIRRHVQENTHYHITTTTTANRQHQCLPYLLCPHPPARSRPLFPLLRMCTGDSGHLLKPLPSGTPSWIKTLSKWQVCAGVWL